MGRAPCCDKTKVKRGPWSLEEDTLLKNFIHVHGTAGNWISLPPKAGLNRCGKSCRLRWLNYLRPNIKHGGFTEEEDYIICTLYSTVGSRWSVIASKLSGRTDNDVKNYWNTKLKKKIIAGKVLGFEDKLVCGDTYTRNGTGLGSTRFIEMDPKPEPTTYEYGTSFIPNPQVVVGQTWDPLGMNYYYSEELGILSSQSDQVNSSSVSFGSSSVQREELEEDDIDDFWWKLLVDQSTFMGGCGTSQGLLHEKINELASVVRGPP